MKSDMPEVDVLLATYNGSAFLSEQIESILGQDFRKIRILVRDDGSTDDSKVIVRSFVDRYPEQVLLLEDSMGNLGSAMNFLQLLQLSTAAYVMLSDQDDVWFPEKVTVTMTAMKEMESRYGRHTPILIHTDLVVAREDLTPISSSFWGYQKIDPEYDQVNRLLVQNVVTGCTVMVNRDLVGLIRPVMSGVIEHDWWLALLAASLGRIGYVARPTVLYRQHGNNVVGAVKWDPWAAFGKFFYSDSRTTFVVRLSRTRVQALKFLQVYEPLLAVDVALIIRHYALLDRLNIFSRLICVFRYRFFKIGLKRNIGMLLSLMVTPRQNELLIKSKLKAVLNHFIDNNKN